MPDTPQRSEAARVYQHFREIFGDIRPRPGRARSRTRDATGSEPFTPGRDPKPLADALQNAPPGKLIEADAYYAFSSVFFYTNQHALLWNGRMDNLEYGSYAPGAPQVFIDDREFQRLWCGQDRYYLLALAKDVPHVKELAGESPVEVVKESGGKFLMTNSR